LKLPAGEKAMIDPGKLIEYCLNPYHSRGKHKARVFEDALGLTLNNYETLQHALAQAAVEQDARPGKADQYGQRYIVDFRMQGIHGSASIRSIWIIRANEDFPRLASCYVL
jgi:hypothetical protein